VLRRLHIAFERLLPSRDEGSDAANIQIPSRRYLVKTIDRPVRLGWSWVISERGEDETHA